MRRRLVSTLLIATLTALVGSVASACGSEDEGDTLSRALAAHADRRVDEAVQLYRDVLAEDSTNKFAHYNLGLIEQTRGRTEAAETEYRQALETDARFVPALFNLAILRSKTDTAEAIDLYRRVLAVEPDNATAHLNLGFLLKQTGAEADGQAELDKAVELDPSLAERVASPSPSPEGPAGP